MEDHSTPLAAIDEYIARYPGPVQERLRALRACIRAAAPAATEKIAWGMPTFTLHGNLIHFAAHQKHIGLYPGPAAVEAFRERLAGYGMSKGAVRLPHDRPLPLELVAEIVRFGAAENEALAESRRREKKSPADSK